MSAVAGRHEARRVALEILYQADITGTDALVALEGREAGGGEVPPFARELVEGAAADIAPIDELLGSHAEGWAVRRMAAVDRTILRLATFELRARPDVPTGAIINEAVEAANELSTEESGRFVNGILGRLARELRPDEVASR